MCGQSPVVFEGSSWPESLGASLAPVKRYEELEVIRRAEPFPGITCARWLEHNPDPDAIQRVLTLRFELERVHYLRGHNKRSATYAWARSAGQELDALLRARGAVYVSPRLPKLPFDAVQANQLILHGHLGAAADWADHAIAVAAQKASKAARMGKRPGDARAPTPPALVIRACIDLLRDDASRALQRMGADVLEARKQRNPREGLVLVAIAHAMLGDVDSALHQRRELARFSAEMPLAANVRVVGRGAAGSVLEAHGRRRLTRAGREAVADVLFGSVPGFPADAQGVSCAEWSRR